jgi:hypothetical protein
VIDSAFRPKYVSFDCYGTLIDFQLTPVTRELVGDRLTAAQFERFVTDFRALRYDQVCRERMARSRRCSSSRPIRPRYPANEPVSIPGILPGTRGSHRPIRLSMVSLS